MENGDGVAMLWRGKDNVHGTAFPVGVQSETIPDDRVFFGIASYQKERLCTAGAKVTDQRVADLQEGPHYLVDKKGKKVVTPVPFLDPDATDNELAEHEIKRHPYHRVTQEQLDNKEVFVYTEAFGYTPFHPLGASFLTPALASPPVWPYRYVALDAENGFLERDA